MASIPNSGILYAGEARSRIFFCRLQVSDHERRISDAQYIVSESEKNPFPCQEKLLSPHLERIRRSEGHIKMLMKEIVYLEKLVAGGLPEAGRLIKVPEVGCQLPTYTFPSRKLEEWRGRK